MIQAPRINTSQFQNILEQAKALVPFYVPEWKISDNNTPDAALLKIFAHMVETVISRLNQVPDKNLVAFLDMLGIKLVPARSARAPLTFLLSQGATENVLIPERSQAAAGELIFETEKNFLATPAKLVNAFSINMGADGIYRTPSNVIDGKTVSSLTTRITYQALKGEKDFFLDDVTGIEKGDVLKVGEAEYVMVSEISGKKLSLVDGLSRSVPAAAPAEKVTIFELFTGKNLQEHILYLGHKDLFNIKPGDAPSSLSLKFKVLESGAPYLSYEWSYWGEDKKTKKDGWVVTTPEKDDTSVFTKTGDIKLPIGSEIKETAVNGVKSRWLRCKLLSPKAPILRSTRLPLLDTVSVDMQNTVVPEMAFYNDVPLDLTTDEQTGNFNESLYPFGKKPRLFDTFYIGSAEAFSKKGASITLNFAVKGVLPADIPVEEIYGIGPTFTKRLRDGGINTVSQMMKYKPGDLTEILGTNKNTAINIMTSAKKRFREATRVAELESAETGDKPTLSWEYWNGKGWMVIKEVDDEKTDSLTKEGEVFFLLPDDIQATQVGGQDSYWVRVRIVSGDYGQELVYDKSKNEWVSNNINPPFFKKLTVTYAPVPQTMDYYLSYNNLEFMNVTEESKATGKPFKPFRALEDEHQSLYLGFDKKVESGPISVFFSLEEAKYVEETMPRIVWEYYVARETGGEWSRLEVLDGTRILTRSGTVEFVLPEDFSSANKFGKTLYWIRAADAENRFQSLSSIFTKYLETFPAGGRFPNGLPYKSLIKDYKLADLVKLVQKSTAKESLKAEVIEPCIPTVEIFHPAWYYPAEVRKYPPNPRIAGIYPNTTWAIQAETVKDEILGSGSGEANQTFSLTKIPIISEEIWVNEVNALSEEQMKEVLAGDVLEAKEDKDDKGNVTAFWVKWQVVEDLMASSKTDRHCELDRISGSVKFGDGINGAIPPAGSDNIKADYRTGGGEAGNVGRADITALKTSVPFVDKVSNPVAAAGGSDVEPLAEAMERGPQVIRHRNRAVTGEDFEWLAKQASHAIARAKCLPNFNDKGERQPGWVTVIIVPESEEEQPEPSLELKSQVESYLNACSANTVVSPVHLQVSAPVYVSVGVEATIVAKSMDYIPLVENEAISRLKEFLHPLTGGYEGRGWDFGRSPCLSDFFSLLEKIDGVNYVKTLSIKIKAGEGQSASEYTITPERARDIEMPPYTLVYSGEHKITVTFQKES